MDNMNSAEGGAKRYFGTSTSVAVRRALKAGLLAATAFSFAPTAWAQEASTAAGGDTQVSEEGQAIIVTARRKAENIQDVPLAVNTVSNETLSNLNIRRFEDLSSVVPGLTLTNGTFAATVRGVAFNVFASGANGTIGFYLNDAPIGASDLFKTMYDIGQVELLRGPQGTLRGRASPSGALTITTRRPDLDEIGGYVNGTATTLDGYNLNGAVSVPIVPGVLALRVAGMVERNEGTRVRSVNNPLEQYNRAHGWRATAVFQPANNLSFIFTAENYRSKQRTYTQVESISQVAGKPFIRAADRLAVQDTPAQGVTNLDSYNLQARWSFAGQRLEYVGQRSNRSNPGSRTAADVGDFFGPGTPAVLQGYGPTTAGNPLTWAHELRLSSEDRIAGIFDYTIGALSVQLHGPLQLTSTTVLYTPPAATATVIVTPTERGNDTRERSVFGNLTAHLGEATEISAGARYIHYGVNSFVCAGAPPCSIVPNTTQNSKFNAWIYTASVKHNFSDDLMVYGSFGTSWRPGITVIGNNSIAQGPRERSFLILPPEKSKSLEVGLKSTIERNMRLNLSAFYQRFDNFPFRAPTPQYFVETINAAGVGPVERVTAFNFVAPVPAKVWGGELEWSYAPNPHWDISLNLAYADSKISNGVVPCNDFAPADGVPDVGGTPPTVAQIRAAAGGANIAQCTANVTASTSSPWSGNLQTEYRMPLSPAATAFARGLFTYYGNNKNDPLNGIDDIKSYGIVNLFAGVRAESGAWELALYAKNLFNTQRVLSRDTNPISVAYRAGAAAVNGVTSYRTVIMTDPREFGVNLRYAFGSR